MIGRRAILKAFGLAPVAAVASSSSVIGAEQSLAGIGAGANAALGSSLADIPGIMNGTSYAAVLEYFTKNGFPDFYMERLKEDADCVHRLDADLASNRSFSLSTKMREQKKRNLDSAISQAWARKKRNVVSEQFRRSTGMEIW